MDYHVDDSDGTPVVSHGSYLTAPLGLCLMGVIIGLCCVGLKIWGNRPDLFPFAWWALGFWIGGSFLMLCIAAALRAARRNCDSNDNGPNGGVGF